VKILQKWVNISAPIWQIAENPKKYVDTNINVTGAIDRIYESYFYLVDTNEEFSIVVYYDSSRFYNLSEGYTVCVCGRFVYDAATLRYVLETNLQSHYIRVKW
jgi:hypothetical protein